MDLDDVYGGPATQQRFYARTLTVKLEGKEKKVVYQSFPGSAPAPVAFETVRDRTAYSARTRLAILGPGFTGKDRGLECGLGFRDSIEERPNRGVRPPQTIQFHSEPTDAGW